MARVVKVEEHVVKRNEILDVVQRLIYTKGYEAMSIQDIIAALNISKGAFYHYFDSKSALLEALLLRLEDEAEKIVIPIVEDPQLNGLQKLQRIFAATSAWKIDQKEFLACILEGWYADHNAIVRDKMTRVMTRRISVFLSQAIQQGVTEGLFNVPHSEHLAEVTMTLLIGLGTNIAQFFVDLFHATDMDQRQQLLNKIESAVVSYTEAVERILGAPQGSIEFMNFKQIKDWATVTAPATKTSLLQENAYGTTNGYSESN